MTVNRIGYVEAAGGSKVYVNPQAPSQGVNTEVMPAAGLTADGKWIVIAVNPDGTLPPPGSVMGAAHFDESQQDVTPGADQVLVDQLVPAGSTRTLSQVMVVTRVTGSFSVLQNGSVIGSGRTGPGCLGLMPFSPGRTLAPGDGYQVTFRSRPGAPEQSVECYVQATDVMNT